MFPTPTHEELLIEHKNKIIEASQASFNEYRMQVQAMFNMFWHSEFSPQEIADILGPSALQLFSWHGKAQEFLKSIDENYEILSIPEGFTVTPKEDGSISITN